MRVEIAPEMGGGTAAGGGIGSGPVTHNAELVELLTNELQDHTRRKKMVDDSIDELDALNADEYPEMPLADVSAKAFADMQLQATQIDAAIAQFTPVSEDAAAITVELGEATDNP